MSWMFSYGMNTNIGEMKLRCPNSKLMGASVLMNFKFRFANHADITPEVGSVVHGVLWEITESCLHSLDILEGYPYYYDRILVPVNHNGTVHLSWVYHMQPGRSVAGPSTNYLALVQEGYGQNSVPMEQISLALQQCEKLTKNN